MPIRHDPAIGKFIQADSLVPAPGNPQSLNRYAYVYNNPLRYTDPSGHCPVTVTLALKSATLYFASPHGQSTLAYLGKQAAYHWAMAEALVVQAAPGITQWLQAYGPQVPMLLEAAAQSGNTPPRSGDQSRGTANQGGFDPQNPWKAFRDAGMATEGIRALEGGLRRHGTDLNRAYQDFMFFKERGINAYGHALVEAQERGISRSMMLNIYSRADGYGTRLYESGTEGHIAIWSTTKDVAVIVDKFTRSIVTTYRPTGPQPNWRPLSPFDTPEWLLK